MTTTMDSSLTLGEAIQKLRREEDPAGQVANAMSGETAAAFDMHDAVHILFGCDTSLEGEIAAHVWMKYGTTARVSDMHRAVANQEHRKVLAGLGHMTLVRTWARMSPRIVGIVLRTRGMSGRLPFERLSQLKQQTLASIRREYGIRV